MKSRPQRASITRRLTVILMVTSSTAVLLAGVAFITFSVSTSRWAAIGDLTSLARITGQNCGAALSFGLPEDAVNMLATLNEKPSIVRALLHDAEGRFLAEFTRDSEEAHAPVPEDMSEGHVFSGRNLWIAHRIEQDEQFLGTIWLQDDLSQLRAALYRDSAVLGAVTLASLLVAYWMAARLRTRITRSIFHLAEIADTVSEKHDYSVRAVAETEDEVGRLTLAFNGMLNDIQEREAALRTANEGLSRAHDELEQRVEERTAELEKHSALKTGLSELHEAMRGEIEPGDFGRNVLRFLCQRLQCPVGAFYEAGSDDVLRLIGSYAFAPEPGRARMFQMEEGVVGQAAHEQTTLKLRDVPPDYFRICSGLGDTVPKVLRVIPVLYENRTAGVIELGSLQDLSADETLFLEQALPSIGMSLHSAIARRQRRELLERMQGQAEELQTQQEELRVANEELAGQTQALEESRDKLQSQQEELQVTNEELEEQKEALEGIKVKLEQQAEALSQANQYKSEFLANMSHELRTPLNSLLILADLLAANKQGNLDETQIRYARVIHDSGVDLLDLINDILDLSKVEAGRLEAHWENCAIEAVVSKMQKSFDHVADEKGLEFVTSVETGLPPTLRTDGQRLGQILRNLLSNAFKFTRHGSVRLDVKRPGETKGVEEGAIAFEVVDTGSGIPPDKQKLIFESFQQADGSTSRKYGGTGLGLSITREFTNLLHGSIHVQSEEGQGSTFTLVLPLQPPKEAESAASTSPRPKRVAATQAPIPAGDDRKILIVEDDITFAGILENLSRERGFDPLVAHDGATGLELAFMEQPSAILLDIGLPDMDGMSVMEKLKGHPDTRHIPVHVISAMDEQSRAEQLGAVGYLSKPVSRKKLVEAFRNIESILTTSVRKLLVVENDKVQGESIVAWMGAEAGDLEVIVVPTAEEALEKLEGDHYDCMILDLSLGGAMSGYDLLERLDEEDAPYHPPVIIYTSQDLGPEDEDRLSHYTQSIVIKGVKSPERLLEEATLFLHRVESRLPDAQREMLRHLHEKDTSLRGKTVLLVDDDMRNVFALTGILEEQGMQVVVGRNGREAMRRLEERPDMDLVLTDIMMPEMDGYELLRAIRKQSAYGDLPVIAMTAKAMREDREDCMKAGASDYLSKPIDVDRLLSLLRVWLHG